MEKKVYFGTYTKRGKSEGLYSALLNTDTKELHDLKLEAKMSSPTFLAVSKKNLLYAVDKREDLGGVSTFDVTTEPWVKTDSQVNNGSSPAHITVDEDRQLVYAAFYHRGTVEVFEIKDKELVRTDIFQNEGNGPRPQQQSSHMHFSGLTPDKKVVAVDLGTDEVITFDVTDDHKLVEFSRFKTEAGFGPRHIVFNSNGNRAYLLGELSSKLSVLEYNNGSFKLIQTVNNLPEDFDGENGAAAIRISNDDKFVYTSNRGHNSIAVFAVAEDENSVENIQFISTNGDFPRDFNFTSDQEIAIAANQNTDNVSVYTRDAQSGKLTLVNKDFYAPEAICVYIEA